MFAGITINGTGGADTIYLTVSGTNLVVTNNSAVTNYVLANVSDITINGGAGADDLEVSYQIYAPCVIAGNAGDDVIFGGSGNDSLYGGDGRDAVHGKNGNDIVDSGNGDANLVSLSYGEAGNDTIYGGNYDDKMYGGTGGDDLYGKAGTNTFCANDGDNNPDGAADHFFHWPNETYSYNYGTPGEDTFAV